MLCQPVARPVDERLTGLTDGRQPDVCAWRPGPARAKLGIGTTRLSKTAVSGVLSSGRDFRRQVPTLPSRMELNLAVLEYNCIRYSRGQGYDLCVNVCQTNRQDRRQDRQRNARPKPRTTESQVLNVGVVSEVVIKRTKSRPVTARLGHRPVAWFKLFRWIAGPRQVGRSVGRSVGRGCVAVQKRLRHATISLRLAACGLGEVSAGSKAAFASGSWMRRHIYIYQL